MRSKLRRALETLPLRRERRLSISGLVVIIALGFALAWAMPSVGASAGKLARKALARANQAFHNANLAIDSADTAKTNANAASSTANAAASAASEANTTANQALAKANSIVPGGRAFARVDAGCSSPSLSCARDRVRGITGVRQPSTGTYCITASGLSATTASWIASVDGGDTSAPEQARALPATGSGCDFGEFQVRTIRSTGGGTSAAGDVAFFIVIP